MRPNVLLVLVDDLNCDIACYGAQNVKTPHIDALAGRGVRFANAYAQATACNPSRASLLTGRNPTATRVLDNRTSYREALPAAVTLARHFRNHGYVTAAAGKIAHRGFDDREAWARHGKFRLLSRDRSESPRARRARRRQADRWAASGPGPGEGQRDYQVADHAIRLLNQIGKEPFFLAVGFDTTHPPLVSPRSYHDLYERQEVELPADFSVLPRGDRPAFRENTGLFQARRGSPEAARSATKAYWAATSFVDAQLGRLLEELDHLALRESTVVVFASDHGFHLGEKGLWGKSTLFERGLRVPLVIAGPGIAADTACTRPVQLVDLYPTLVDLANLPQPGPLDGRSLKPLLVEPGSVWPHAARSWLQRGDVFGATLRTEHHRYTEWDEGAAGRELYDHRSDSDEARNLADDPSQAAVVARLSAALRAAAGEREMAEPVPGGG
ncbi:MAG: sulfatase [Deltaproteobacteria bacterium]|nr:sulfatase [Deltaproteobacteria bacterium]